MKSTNFRAVGFETEWSFPADLFSWVGIGQFLILLVYIQLTNVAPPFFDVVFPISLGLLVVAMGVLWVAGPHFRGPVMTFDIQVTDKRDEGGALELSYVDSEGVKRDGVRVNSVRARPRQILVRPILQAPNPVKGTNASLSVKFAQRRGGLELGFTSAMELNEVYLKLRDPQDPDLRF